MEQERRRAYFVAQLIVVQYNKARPKDADPIDVDGVLSVFYPVKGVVEEYDENAPEHGAKGDWRALKGSMMSVTESKKQRRSRKDVLEGG